ncbi:hypothetical protein Q666_14890 [Marinobacter sp. ES-1]|nr:hypothetical protein Q666_14890 [Marinobacter sp. ES-1]
MAAVIGGHTYLTQNQTKIAKAIDCPINVRFIFTAIYLLLFVASWCPECGGSAGHCHPQFSAD